MFGTRASHSAYYYGNATYKYIDELIRNKGDVLVVSPYIDKYYADMMLKSAGRKFYVISSEPDDAAMKLLMARPSRSWIAGYGLLSVAVLLLMLYARIGWPYVLISLIPVVAGAATHRGRRKNVELKVPRRFTHAKMYISDSMAVTGSANLTYSGMHRNIEHVNVTYSGSDIDKLKDQFWSMWEET